MHTDRARTKARELGGFAGMPDAAHLWSLSKRELIEIALRLGAECSGDVDSWAAGVDAVEAELSALREAGIL